MTIDDGCQVEAWQKVNLRKAQMVTYEDADGNEVKRMRIPDMTMCFSFSRMFSDFWKVLSYRKDLLLMMHTQKEPSRLCTFSNIIRIFAVVIII